MSEGTISIGWDSDNDIQITGSIITLSPNTRLKQHCLLLLLVYCLPDDALGEN